MRTLYAGAGLALTAGLVLGAAMKPRLAIDDGSAGPQAVASATGASSTSAFDDPNLARYGGRPPDYVMGADWRKLTQAAATPRPAEMLPLAPAVDYYDSPLRDDPPTPEPRPQAEPSELTARDKGERVSFPSIDGGMAIDAAARAQAAPAGDVGDEAPPEAAGDTSVAR